MKTIILILCLISTYANASASLSGQAKIDSLINELPNSEQDTNKVKLLISLSFQFYSIDPDTGIEYGMNGAELSTKLNWKKGLANCYNSIGVNYSNGKHNSKSAMEYYLKALKLNKEIGNNLGIADNLLNIGVIYKNKFEYAKALDNYSKSLKINQELGNKERLAKNYLHFSIVYRNQSNYPKALEYLFKSLELSEELNDQFGIASNLTIIGNIYYEQSDYPKALEYYFKSLKICEEQQYTRDIARNLSYIGALYKKQSDYENAIEYYQQSYNIFDEIEDLQGKTSVLGNIGLVYKNQKNYEKALEYYQKSLKLSNLLNNKNINAIILVNIATIYHFQSNYSKALEYFSESLKIIEELGHERNAAIILNNMGETYYSLSQDTVIKKLKEPTDLVSLNAEINLNQSIKHSKKALMIFESIGDLNSRSGTLNTLSNAYKQKGDYKNSDKYLREHIVIKDSVFNEEKAKELGYMTAERDRLIKDRELEEEARRKAKEIEYRNNTQYLSISIFIILLGILMMLSGKIQMSEWVARGLVFITFILLFEFILVVIDPITDDYSEGEPFIKLGINLCIAFVLYPIHQFFNRKVSRIIVKRGGGTAVEKIIKEFNEKKNA